jgi:hypothetical protein
VTRKAGGVPPERSRPQGNFAFLDLSRAPYRRLNARSIALDEEGIVSFSLNTFL